MSDTKKHVLQFSSESEALDFIAARGLQGASPWFDFILDVWSIELPDGTLYAED